MDNPSTITLHGVFLSIAGLGTLITGASGMGKSEIALELIKAGHKLIADDAPEFLMRDDCVIGHSPALLQDMLEVRGLGILNVRALFGSTAVVNEGALELIIALQHMPHIDAAARLHGYTDYETILTKTIPKIIIPYSQHRPMSLLVECAVRNYQLKLQGHMASQMFEHQQQQALLS